MPHLTTAASFPPRVQAYLDVVVQTCADNHLVSLILFGSAATGGWSETMSDVDLILVVPDATGLKQRLILREQIEKLETLHGFGHQISSHPLERLMDRVGANVRSFFICTRADLLSGSVARILDIRRWQAACVDRVVLANIVYSGATVWGEYLLSRVPVAPIRRLDVFKALFGLFGQLVLIATLFPFVSTSTRYAMAVLKRSVHNCFFCYHLCRDSLEAEVAFFVRQFGSCRTLERLLDLRRAYQSSFAFAISCLPALLRLHLRTAMDNRFPIDLSVRLRQPAQ